MLQTLANQTMAGGQTKTKWTMRSVRWPRVREPGCAEIFFVPFLFRADANYCTVLTDVFGIFSDFFAEERNKIEELETQTESQSAIMDTTACKIAKS